MVQVIRGERLSMKFKEPYLLVDGDHVKINGWVKVVDHVRGSKARNVYAVYFKDATFELYRTYHKVEVVKEAKAKETGREHNG